ncbi:Protein of unknown function [Solimonas aquatica]|uniref:YetF C-terminal domain-containing protein n=1 Tax=Solimonas aquatica TaxID=489703 RepID=A0A1H9K0I3_9GAMM|nr:YetF domain-containing protein [Solimonas aquatica]SEQ92423.1 Protein of unknown function [Solimonas aquatica]
MHSLWQVDWRSLFIPSGSLLEIVIRGSCIYLLLIFLLRALRREAGQIGIADVLVIVIIADAAQNAMAGTYNSITEGVLLILTIMGWDYLLDYLSLYSPRVRRWLHPDPLLLIQDGRIRPRNLRRAMISQAELLSRLRQDGLESESDVERCYLEGDGHISVIKKSR